MLVRAGKVENMLCWMASNAYVVACCFGIEGHDVVVVNDGAAVVIG